MTTKKQVATCIQCEGDAMLEVRKHADEAFTCMNLLSIAYGDRHKPGTTVVDFVRALIDAEKDQRRLVKLLADSASRRVKEADEIIAGLKFVSDATRDTYSSGVNMSSKSMTIPLTELFRVAIHRLHGMVMQDIGLLDGKQPHNQCNFLSHLMRDA